MKKVVLKVELKDGKMKQKAMAAVASIAEVDSVSVNMKEKTLTFKGNMDEMGAAGEVRKLCRSEIVSVVTTEEKKKEESKKERKKDEAKKSDEEEKKKKNTKKEPEKEKDKKCKKCEKCGKKS